MRVRWSPLSIKGRVGWGSRLTGASASLFAGPSIPLMLYSPHIAGVLVNP
jgi:hypothetical protein